MREGPLDMRMDPTNPISAADLVNTMGGEQLEKIFRNYGEEPAARKIAARLVRDRLVSPFRTTLQLAQAVETVVPRRGRTHPATRVFQALRIAVNRELEALSTGLEQLSQRLAPGGRLAVITFHSLEDRIVKVFFKERTTAFIDRPEWPEARPNPLHVFKAITGKPVVASDAEQRANPRSRSAKLRVVERIPYAR
jgi:16S rRNA (cytosine1402-N4)-methyltransferase